MLFKRNWQETSLRLWLSMAGMLFLTALTVYMYQHSGAAARGADYRGYIGQHLYMNAFLSAWPMMSLVLGAVGLACAGGCNRLMRKTENIAGSLHYLLTLPVTRWQVFVSRLQMIGLQVLVVALVPVLALPLLSPLAGQSYPVQDAVEALPLVLCVGAVFASLGLLLSLIFQTEAVALAVGYGIVLPLAVCASYTTRGFQNPELHSTVLVLLICFLLCSMQVIAAKRILERKEY